MARGFVKSTHELGRALPVFGSGLGRTYGATGGAHLIERVKAGIRIDAARGAIIDRHGESGLQRVERRRAHAEVGGEPSDRDPVDPPLAQQPCQIGPVEA